MIAQLVAAFEKGGARTVDMTPAILSLRAVKHCLIYRAESHGYGLDLFEGTERCGVVSIAARPTDGWYTDLPLALVPNINHFWSAEYLGETERLGAFLYVNPEDYAKLVFWLRTCRRTPKLFIYVDFDVAGLTLASFLIKQIPEAQLYLPPDLESAWTLYGRKDAFDADQFAKLGALVGASQSAMKTALRLMGEHRSCLELDALGLVAKTDEASG